MADVMLMALTVLALCLSAPALFDTKNILRLDVAGALMTLTWLLPQAYALRGDAFTWYYDPTFTYGYVFVCIAMLSFGSLLGRRAAERNIATGKVAKQEISSFRYDPKKLANAALIMTGMGGASFVLMAREAQNFGIQEQWTGVITLYYLLSQFMVFGGALGILIYMQYEEKRGLVAYLAMLAVAVPIFLIFVRRSVLFQIAAITIGAVILNKRVKIPRSLLLGGLVISVMILNGTAAIRQHVFNEGGSIVTAFTEGVMFKDNFVQHEVIAAELRSAISDIEVARATNHYKPFVMLWNISVSQYVPGFIVGDERKSSFLIPDENRSVLQTYFTDGATRTGFAEAFSGYWYFGPLIYMVIGFIFGRLWILTNMRDIKAQHTYLVFLLYSLLTITESISRMLVTAPIILISIWVSFRYARRPLVDDRAMKWNSQPG